MRHVQMLWPIKVNKCNSKKTKNRFSLRRKQKVQSQWQLYCMIHNREKFINDGEILAKNTWSRIFLYKKPLSTELEIDTESEKK
ncbi:hypothetical protein FKG94_26725 [Exilibacterium tricleocarpae]|uniref:Uncharacterized protein n=1 Tax=Exilibacterium tricleocarpae TaxID=2591008 RepID=A0A545SNY4_9GAMM|nr:hypothetical protein FKG94_26725 [Exilibacterium tricleocarpae]